MTKVIKIEGMSCMHCVKRVDQALKTLDGVTGVSVNLELKQASVDYQGSINDEVIKSVIDDAGYDVLSIKESL
ncbi:MAG: heavy-metal-associated domain-containing protein [Paracholeplasma sp.]|nr:heavy-metal-associated domain-containing protein [Paracholeplasma sp.]MDY3196170.1 heavy-metal-associated domain-containing protein [Paracholeplasma sp.]